MSNMHKLINYVNMQQQQQQQPAFIERLFQRLQSDKKFWTSKS